MRVSSWYVEPRICGVLRHEIVQGSYTECVSQPPAPDVNDIRAMLRAVMDPELGDNIVDLGMAGDVVLEPGDGGYIDQEGYLYNK